MRKTRSTMTITRCLLFIALCLCIVTGPEVTAASRSNTVSYWTQKQPCNRMEWNDLPACVTVSARPCPSSDALLLQDSPPSSSVAKKVKKKDKNAANDDHDDHYDLVVLGCVIPSSSTVAVAVAATTTVTTVSSSEVVVQNSYTDNDNCISTKTLNVEVAANVTGSSTSPQESDSNNNNSNNNNRLLSWLHSRGITPDLVHSLQSEISQESTAGTTSGIAYVYSRNNNNISSPLLITNDIAGTVAVGATPTLQRLVCLSLLGQQQQQQQQQPTVSRAADARKVGTALAALVASKNQERKQQTSTGASKIQSCALYLPTLTATLSDSSSMALALDEAYVTELLTALYVGLYRDERFKSQNMSGENADESSRDTADKYGTASNSNTLRRIDLIYDDDNTSKDGAGEEGDNTSLPPPRINWERAIHKARILAEGVYLAKDIVNAPHNVLNSLALAETAHRLAAQHGPRLSCQVLSAEQCEELGMGAFLGVARGSETPAQFLHLTYTPPPPLRKHWWSWGRQAPVKDCKRLGIVGKGLLFDTGGYNIKTQMMELMKFDCGGAAAVLGAARAIAQLQPVDVEIHFVVAACENMINEKAMVPGDILSASNGKTIEVANTDAEGRLTMADALVYVDQTLQCDEILELSTLTGACVVALGSSIAGLWTKNDALAASLLTASATTGEKIWRMPMEEEYTEDLKSKIADLKNLGGRYGGAIAAALFLQEFIKGDKPFAHVDMAGPVWSTKAGQATGWGAKLVTEWACQSRP